MKKIDELTGAVSVDGDVTPTTREEIKKVDANEWSNLSISELWEQKSTLLNRMTYAQQSGSPQMVAAIQRGINTIDQILTSKHTESPTSV